MSARVRWRVTNDTAWVAHETDGDSAPFGDKQVKTLAVIVLSRPWKQCQVIEGPPAHAWTWMAEAGDGGVSAAELAEPWVEAHPELEESITTQMLAVVEDWHGRGWVHRASP
ncbi:MAG: hypothetical protein Q4G34_00545 [Micrococcus sp.]|nr:hypothetical protein [Micrococcus sp.]